MNRIALVFPGQGSQYVGMGKKLFDNYSEAREVFEEASDTLGIDMKKLCFEGDLQELTKTENTQPAMLTASVAAYRVYMKEIGIKPEFGAGHSLGEFSALTCAGAIQFSDCIRIVKDRGKFMQEAASLGSSGIMMAISGVKSSLIEEECEKSLQNEQKIYVSNYNSPEQTVISGLKEPVEKLGQFFSDRGARVSTLKVSAPFHCPIMEPAAAKLEEVLNKYTYNTFEWSVISNVTAVPYEETKEIVYNLKKQIVVPVRWKDTMDFIKRQEIDIIIEIGPKAVLKGLTGKNIADIMSFSYDFEQDQNDLKEQLNINEAASDYKPTVIGKAIEIAVTARNRNWNNEEYEKGVIVPYREVLELQAEIEKENRRPTIDEMKRALTMLTSVLNTKKVPALEQNDRLKELFEVTGTGDLINEFNFLNL